MIQITDVKCPDNKGGGVHHLTPRPRNGAMVMACLTCKKTQAELQDQLDLDDLLDDVDD